jgi:TRAP-type C4-dicarboxylate transport system permease small subunit
MRRLLDFVNGCTGYASALFLAAMMLITVADVTLRAFRAPITGAYDLVQLFLVGTVFLSVPDLFLNERNIVVDFIDHLAGGAVVLLLRLIAGLSGIGFLAVLSWRMITPALDAWRFGEVSPDLSIPMALHWSLMIAGVVLALLAAVWRLIEWLRAPHAAVPRPPG